MRLDITLKPVRVPYKTFTVPMLGTYRRVKHDWQDTPEWGTLPRAREIWGDTMPESNPAGGLPDTCRTYPTGDAFETVKLTLAWQVFWFECLRLAVYNQMPEVTLKERWAEITEHGRALTDNTAVKQGYTDYILGLNLGSVQGDMRQKPLTMGGNIVKVLYIQNGYTHVEALNLSQPPPPLVETFKKPWLVQWATQSTIIPYNGGYKVTDWGQLNWNGVGYGVPFLLVSPNGSVKIPNDWLMPIASGATYTPYNP